MTRNPVVETLSRPACPSVAAGAAALKYQATSKTGPPTSLKTGPPCLQRSVCVPLQRRLVQVGPQAAPALRSACRLKALRCAREQPVDYLDKPVSWRGLRLCGQRDQARAALLAQPVTV